jgi:hypothetical protein
MEKNLCSGENVLKIATANCTHKGGGRRRRSDPKIMHLLAVFLTTLTGCDVQVSVKQQD